MNTNPHLPMDSAHARNTGEETLRLIARLPAPQGLEERVEAALRAAPRAGRVLAWPAALRPQPSLHVWMRAAAAAAIVFVVAGGGWGVYTRVEKQQAAKVLVMPVGAPATGGFSTAGAMRTPQTPNGPVLVVPRVPAPAPDQLAKPATRRSLSAAPTKAKPAMEAKKKNSSR